MFFIKIEVIEVFIHAYITLSMYNRATNFKSRVTLFKNSRQMTIQKVFL